MKPRLRYNTLMGIWSCYSGKARAVGQTPLEAYVKHRVKLIGLKYPLINNNVKFFGLINNPVG